MKKPDLSNEKLIWKRDNTGSILSYNIIEIDENLNKKIINTVANDNILNPIRITRNVIIDNSLMYKIEDKLWNDDITVIDSKGNNVEFAYNKTQNLITFKKSNSVNKRVFIYYYIDCLYITITKRNNCKYVIVPNYIDHNKCCGHSISR